MKTRFLLPVFLLLLFLTACNKKEENSQVTELSVDKLAQSVTSWNGDTLPAYLPEQPQVTVLRIVIPAKYKLEWHKHPVINAGVLLSGELTVISEKQDTLHLHAGEALVELVNTYHYGINEGDEPAEIIVFYAGNEGVPITVKRE